MKFFKTILASCLGVILASIVVIGIGSMVIGRMVSNLDKPKTAGPNSVLEITFEKPIPERTNNLPVNPYEFRTDNIIGLQAILHTIETAKDDKNIKGILLDLNSVSNGQATSSVLRKALQEFKESGKFVIAYSKYYSQGAYYLASMADEIYLMPLGGIDFKGYAATIPFFKDMLDRLGVKAQIYYAGKFKSATEPFRRNDMSEESKLQVREYLSNMYEVFLNDISTSRNIDIAELKNIADGYLIRNADDAVKYKLVDSAIYRDEVNDKIREKLGIKEEDKVKTINLYDYAEAHPYKKDYGSKNKIAVVYAEGEIVDGNGEPGNIGGDKYAKLIRKIRLDDKVKAIVLRVNSGGGSAMASDIMWRELTLAKKQGIPVIASMGDVAASGGYYIACAADSILAEPNTVTGSIGVFGMLPGLEDLFSDKAGIHFDSVKTAPFATGLTPFFTMSPEQSEIIQAQVDEVYETFLSRVAEGRNMTTEQVHEIAQGRVWAGKTAQKIGLVDGFGGLEDAIAMASGKAGLNSYRLDEYPAVKEPIQQMIEEFTGKDDNVRLLVQQQLGDLYPYFQYLEQIKKMQGPQARLPFTMINGQ